MANEQIKEAARQAGVKLWEVADAIGVTDSTFSRQLRRELNPEKQQRVIEAIERLSNRSVEREVS